MVFIDTEFLEDDVMTKEQLAFVDGALANSTAPWKLVIGHHPVWSGGDHGPTKHLVDKLKPIMETHRVDAYIWYVISRNNYGGD